MTSEELEVEHAHQKAVALFLQLYPAYCTTQVMVLRADADTLPYVFLVLVAGTIRRSRPVDKVLLLPNVCSLERNV